MSNEFTVYVGSRTTRERKARGDGINVYRMSPESGRWTHEQLVSGLVNPSFLALDRRQRLLFCVHGDSSDISSFRIDRRNGRLDFVSRQSTEGRNPVHVAVDATNRYVIVPNHVTSSLVVLPFAPDGTLGPVSQKIELRGRIGPHRIEQPFAKPHHAEFDPARRIVVVPDKGLDRIFTYFFTPGGKLVACTPEGIGTRENAGPRHAAFHPTAPFVYVVNELDNSVAAYRLGATTGILSPFQIVPSLPDDFTANSRGSEIAVAASGRFLYVSNRGCDSIGVFAIDPSGGRLSAVEWVASQGRTPRFFAFDPSGRFACVANEDSDTIVTFRVDSETGRLSPTGDVVATGSPVCIVFRTGLAAAPAAVAGA